MLLSAFPPKRCAARGDRSGRAAGRSCHGRSAFASGAHGIERRCCDAAFDVRGLASKLTISTTRLYAAFEHAPTTPAQAWASKVDGANAVLIKGTRGCADLIVSRTAAGGVI